MRNGARVGRSYSGLLDPVIDALLGGLGVEAMGGWRRRRVGDLAERVEKCRGSGIRREPLVDCCALGR
jgi:hypothetical protein